MLKTKHVCMLIPDGVGVKNYLFSDIIKLIKEKGQKLTVWHPMSDRLPIDKNLPVEHASLALLPETFKVRLWREAICFARLVLNAKKTNNPTILTNWRPNKKVLSRKILYTCSEFLGSKWKSETKVLKEEARLNQMVKKSRAFEIYKRELELMQIDFLLCTHQRIPQALPIILAAESLGIKTATVIFSWDNVPKARLPFRSDHYFVWSDYMKDELTFYYSDIEEEKITITSTPQFDHYQDQSLIESREDFAARYGLDPAKYWVLFSGDDRVTSPYDADYLQDMEEVLADQEDIELLFRQVPVESTERYDHILSSSQVKHIPPLWKKGETWIGFMPTQEDIDLLVNLSYHCKLVMNVGSTMALDFAMFDHIGLYINYDQPHSQNWSVDRIYKFQHFKTMEGLDAVGWINDKDDILPKVRAAIDDVQNIGPDRKEWFKRVAGERTISGAQSITEAILSQLN